MSPLCERILCNLLVGVECFSCPFDHAQRDAKKDKYTEWPPSLHVFILFGRGRVSIPGSQQKPAWQVRRRIKLTKSTHQNSARNASRVDFVFHSWPLLRVAFYFSQIPNPLFFLPCKPQLTLRP